MLNYDSPEFYITVYLWLNIILSTTALTMTQNSFDRHTDDDPPKFISLVAMAPILFYSIHIARSYGYLMGLYHILFKKEYKLPENRATINKIIKLILVLITMVLYIPSFIIAFVYEIYIRTKYNMWSD